MAHTMSVGDVVDRMFQSQLATPKRQRRLRSKTFWSEFGFKMRTKERVEQVKQALKERGLLVNLDDEAFGGEDRDEWIILTYVEPPRPAVVLQEDLNLIDIPTPPDEWFTLIEQSVFESECEVEYYFVMPLIEHLGYEEDDTAIGFPVQMYEGVKKVNKEADCVLFNGLSRDKADALLVIEAKKIERILTEDAVGQARAYALWLTTPYYLVTTGEDMRVYLFRGAIQPDVVLMSFNRRQMGENWSALYRTLHKDSVIEYKARWQQVLAGTAVQHAEDEQA
jgi:Type I restriction enzyme R protein N terminus (HSDR_N)